MPEEHESTITVGENSYIDIEEANEYFAGRLHAESWGQADDSTKEKALKQATKTIDRQRLNGRKTNPSQPLVFPRYPDTEIPQAVKEACCEQALFLLSLTSYERDRIKQHTLGVVGGSIGNANEYSTVSLVAANRSKTILCPEAKELLRPWLLGGVFIT